MGGSGEDLHADDERNRQLYGALVSSHGLSFRSLNWGSAEGQQRRFDILAQIGIAPDASILDVGCGTADLLVYLRATGFTGSYTGVDLTPEMINAARARGLDGEFQEGNVLLLDERARAALRRDYVLASGIFYYRQNAPQSFMEKTLTCLFNLAERGVAFNSLSTWADHPASRDEFRADPMAILTFCRTLTPWVVLRHDYHTGDFTIYLRRHQSHIDAPSKKT